MNLVETIANGDRREPGRGFGDHAGRRGRPTAQGRREQVDGAQVHRLPPQGGRKTDRSRAIRRASKDQIEKKIATARSCSSTSRPASRTRSRRTRRSQCANKAIAEWTVKQLNGDTSGHHVINQLALVDDDGKALEHEAPVLDAKGQPVMSADGDPTYETKPLVKDGKPVVRSSSVCGVRKSGASARAVARRSSPCRTAGSSSTPTMHRGEGEGVRRRADRVRSCG